MITPGNTLHASLPGLANAYEATVKACRMGARPDPKLAISEWADQYRVLTTRSSPEPGMWRTSRTPYLREIMDALMPESPCERVVFMKGSQVGATEAGINWMGYVIHLAPGPMLVVQPTETMAKRNSKQRIGPLIEDCPILSTLVRSPKERDSGNTILAKEFLGGILVLAGANSAKGLRSMAARYLFLDEVDAYPANVDREGEPCDLAIARTSNFRRKKILIASTPTIAGRSRIETFFSQSDQCYYFVPCPRCGVFITLLPEQLQWSAAMPHRAAYRCQDCEKEIFDHEKTIMLAAGEWRSLGLGDGVTKGFHLSSYYSPVGWLSWTQIMRMRDKSMVSPEKLQAFYNTVLGVPWADQGEVPDVDRLYERRELYAMGEVPEGGLVLTAGVDVQVNRIECEVVAWGRNRESWSVDYRVFDGNTNQPEVWAKLAEVLDEEFPSFYGGALRIKKLAVDSGFNTMRVYEWVRRMGSQSVMAVKGETHSHISAFVGAPSFMDVTAGGRIVRGGVRLWPVNTSIGKEELYRALRLNVPDLAAGEIWPAGYCHFPGYGKEFFDQLCAEQLITHTLAGRTTTKWEKRRDRNEALDCFDGETEVLTDAGWSPFANVSNQKLATVELESDAIEFQKPSDLISRNHSGEMIYLTGRRLDILVTPNHRMVTYLPNRNAVIAATPTITLAKDLTQRHQIKLTGRWSATGPCCISIPASSKDDSGLEIEPSRNVKAVDLASFYGWWITEGSAITNHYEGSHRRLVSITQTKTANVEVIAELLDRLPWRFNWNEGVHKFTCTSKQLHNEVIQWGRLQEARRVPLWIKKSGMDVISAFIDAAIAGDGWNQNNGCRAIATICKDLADDYQELFIKLGCAPRIHIRKAAAYSIRGRSGDNTKDQYHVHENAHTKKASLDGGGNGQRGFIGKSVAYDGKVYCATVPNGTLICRRNGQVFVAGNCRIYARAAAAVLRLEVFTDKRWGDIEAALRAGAAVGGKTGLGSKGQTPMPEFRSHGANTDSFLE